MPRVAVTSAADVVVVTSTRASGRLVGSAINRGPDGVRCDVGDAAATVDMAGPELRLGEAIDFALDRGEALKARCAAGTASLDVFVSDEG